MRQKDKCLSCEGKGFYLYAEGKHRNTCSHCEGSGIRAEVRLGTYESVGLKPVSTSKYDSPTRETDYSDSYVQGDLGRINTEYWNGNKHY